MYTQWYYKYRADEQKRRNKINFKKIKKSCWQNDKSVLI